jgi:hypothetical protein
MQEAQRILTQTLGRSPTAGELRTMLAHMDAIENSSAILQQFPQLSQSSFWAEANQAVNNLRLRQLQQTLAPERSIYMYQGSTAGTLAEELIHYDQMVALGIWGTARPTPTQVMSMESDARLALDRMGFYVPGVSSPP